MNKFFAYRKALIQKKIEATQKFSKDDEKRLSFLAQTCWDRAVAAGTKLPKRNLVVADLEGDPYTWVIVQLGVIDKEIFRCRMTLEDIANARLYAKEEKEKEESGN